jgi:hypothetical protein
MGTDAYSITDIACDRAVTNIFNLSDDGFHEEHVSFVNHGDESALMTDWTLHGPGDNVFVFPTFTLGSHPAAAVWTKSGTDGLGSPIWSYGGGDTAQIRETDREYGRYIALVRYDDDRRRAVVGRLCRHDASWRESSHPHPVFTPDGACVVWGSDLGGRMNVHLARAQRERCALSDR